MSHDKYRPAPGRQGDGKEPSLDTLVSRNMLKQLQRDPPPAVRASHEQPPHAAPPAPKSSGDADLLASMAKRLSQLERDAKERTGMLQRLQVENDALKSKLKVAEEEIQRHAKAQPSSSPSGNEAPAAATGSSTSAAKDDATALSHLRTENGRLRIQLRYAWKQVAEMKEFLSDYGMVWVGADESGGSKGLSRAQSLEGKLPGAEGGAGGVPMPRPPDGAVGTGGAGGAAMRRRISSPNPSGLSAAAMAALAAGAPVASVASQAPLSGPGGVGEQPAPSAPPPHAAQRAGALPAEGAPATSASQPHRPPHVSSSNPSPSHSTLASASSIPTGPSGRASLPPLPKTPPMPSASGASSIPPLGPSNSLSHIPSAPGSSHSMSAASSALPAAAPSSASGGLPFDMQKLLRAVEELNQLAGDGIGQLVGDRGKAGLGGQAAVLQTPDAVRLVLYRDGIQVHRSAAKPYSDTSAKNTILDIMSGYFPIVLKQEFPDGVPLKVVDRTSEPMSVAQSAAPSSNVRTFHDLEDSPTAPESKEHFLSRLPQTVIKNGKVIDIRSEVGRLVGAKSSGAGSAKPEVALVSTPADALLTTMQRNHIGPMLPVAPAAGAGTAGGGAASGGSSAPTPASVLGGTPLPPTSSTTPEIATLQVKSEDGQQTFILKLQYDDTIGALRKCIDAHRSGVAGAAKAAAPNTKYEIRSAFPARAYVEVHETLRQAGLVPNATLFLRAV